MENLKNETVSICGCCKRQLPLDAFYVNMKKKCPDRYCKECRKSVSRKQREADRYIPYVNKKRSYPVITETTDSTLRMNLIRHALQVVAESVERKKRKRWAMEEDDTGL